MSGKTFLGSVTVIVQKLGSGFNVIFGQQNKSWRLAYHDDFGYAVRMQPRMIDKASKSPSFDSGVNTVMFSICFEIIHVAAFGNVHGIFVFSFFGSAMLYELSSIFNDKVTLAKLFGWHNSTVFPRNVNNFEWKIGIIIGNVLQPLDNIGSLIFLWPSFRSSDGHKSFDR